MLKTRIAVLVSGGGTNLQALIDSERAGRIPSGEIRLVLSNCEDAYALKRAQRYGIETAVVIRQKGESRESFDRRMLEILVSHDIQMLILAGFMAILSEEFVRNYPDRIINVHPALIPSFCGKGFYGLKVHEAALAYGVKVTGATVHLVNEVPDGGRILLQKAVDVLDTDTPETLQRRVMEQAEWVLLPQAAEMIAHRIMKEEKP